MKTTVGFFEFLQAFRAVRPENFDSEGLLILFDYLEELEQEIGEEIELDVIALCCAYRQGTIAEIAKEYGIEPDGVRDYLEEHASVVGETSTGFVYYAS